MGAGASTDAARLQALGDRSVSRGLLLAAGAIGIGLVLVSAGMLTLATTVAVGEAVLALLIGRQQHGLVLRSLPIGIPDPSVLLGASIVVVGMAEILATSGGPTVPAIGTSAAAAVIGLVASWGLLWERIRGRSTDVVLEAAIACSLVGLIAWFGLFSERVGDQPVVPVISLFVAAVLGCVVLMLMARFATLDDAPPVVVLLVLGASCSAVLQPLLLMDELLGADRGGVRTGILVVALGLSVALFLSPDAWRLRTPVTSPNGTSRWGGVLVLAITFVPLIAVSAIARPSSISVRPLAFGLGVTTLLVAVYLRRLLGQVRRADDLVLRDELTRLPNRRHFHEHLKVMVEHCGRSHGRLAVLYVDLDRFKFVNDSMGHAAGNSLLRGVAERGLASMGPDDLFARLGGDEFAAILPLDGPDDERAREVADGMLTALGSVHDIGGNEVYVTPSIGIARFPDDGTDPDTLLRLADAAMYAAKDNGRNQVLLCTPTMRDLQVNRVMLEAELHRALENGELRVYLQPKVDLHTNVLVGAEALIRWQHPDRGLVTPAEFIEVLEESSLIRDVGIWMIDRTCALLTRWEHRFDTDLVISVNVSARQFEMDRMDDVVARCLRRHRVRPSSLELELTESVALRHPEMIAATLRTLTSIGVKVSIDDFGTGYSGLTYLNQLRITGVKIDKSFMDPIRFYGDTSPIVSAVIAMAKGLKLEVVAEGVETEVQESYLRELGCDLAQGYLYSKPVPAQEFERLLMLLVAEGRVRGLARQEPGPAPPDQRRVEAMTRSAAAASERPRDEASRSTASTRA